MKIQYLLAVVVCMAFGLGANAASSLIDCRVVGVSDGDTLTCLTSNYQQYKVRLYGIDAPESRQDYGTQSKNNLSNWVFDKTVTLYIKDVDRYGRLVADVIVDGQSVNIAQVAYGYAWAYRQYLSGNEKNAYIAAETFAQSNKLGLWSMPNPINPADFRKGVKNGRYTPPSNAINSTRNAISFPRTTATQSGSPTCGSKRTCGEMSSCAEAKHYLNFCGLSRLDGDNDGIPCESICR